MPWERMVLSHQTHTTNIRVVTEKDAGAGLVKKRDYENVDGLITNIPNLPLVTFYADCVPLYFVDPVHRAIGLSHSGWRGTVKRMGQCTVEAMKAEYHSRPEDILLSSLPLYIVPFVLPFLSIQNVMRLEKKLHKNLK